MFFAAAVAAITILALALIALYAVATLRERELGQDPYWFREVYLFHGDGPPPGAEVATRAQVGVYLRAGGAGHGYAAGGGRLRPAGAPPSVGLYGPPSVGLYVPPSVWLYGPKPRRGTPGVAPFDSARWFQPRAAH